MSEQACKTPVNELLRTVPLDKRLEWGCDDGSWHNWPIGGLAHEAADEIESLTANEARLEYEIERLSAENTSLQNRLKLAMVELAYYAERASTLLETVSSEHRSND